MKDHVHFAGMVDLPEQSLTLSGQAVEGVCKSGCVLT